MKVFYIGSNLIIFDRLKNLAQNCEFFRIDPNQFNLVDKFTEFGVLDCIYVIDIAAVDKSNQLDTVCEWCKEHKNRVKILAYFPHVQVNYQTYAENFSNFTVKGGVFKEFAKLCL